MSFKDRISLIVEKEGFNGSSLSKKLGYPRSQTVYNIMVGKVFPSFDFLFRLFSAKEFDKYNPIWLITGKGLIYKSEGDQKITTTIAQEPTSNYEPVNTNEMEEQLKFLRELAAERGEEIKHLRREIEILRNTDLSKKGNVINQ